jgi:hypothetical protein
MVEVFKTNVTDPVDAALLVAAIHKAFVSYKANFDLDDCDHILRVKSYAGQINPFPIMVLLKEFGFDSEPLPDSSSPPTGQKTLTSNLITGEADRFR